MDRSDARAVARLGQGSRVEIVSLVRGGAEETYGVEMYAFDRSWPECRFVIGERQLVQFTDQLAKQKRKIKRRRRINALYRLINKKGGETVMRNLLKRLKAFSRSDKGSPEIISTAFDGRTQVQTITSSALDGVTEVLISEDNSSAKRYQIKDLRPISSYPSSKDLPGLSYEKIRSASEEGR